MNKFNIAAQLGRASGRGLVALVLLASVGCASVDAPQTRSAFDVPSYHNDTRSSLGMAARADEILKTVDLPVDDHVSFASVEFKRAEIPLKAIPAAGPHEAAFTLSAAEKLENLTSRTDANKSSIIQTQAPDQGGWRLSEDEFKHAHSGMTCPQRMMVTMFDEGGDNSEIAAVLTGIFVFDDFGNDTACNYQNNERGVYLTFFASKWPDVTLDIHFGSAVKGMVDSLPVQSDARLIVANAKREGETSIVGDTKAAAFILEPDNGVTRKTALWLNRTGDWHVKARATYPVKMAGQEQEFSALEMIAALYHSLKLAEVDAHINNAKNIEVVYQR